MGLDDIKYYVVGIIGFMLVVGGGIYVFGSFLNGDSSLDTGGEISRLNRSLYKASDVSITVDNLRDSVADVDAADTGVLGWLNVLLGAAFNGLKLIASSLDFMSIVASESGMIFGVPSSIVSLLILIPVLIIVFAIYSVITRT